MKKYLLAAAMLAVTTTALCANDADIEAFASALDAQLKGKQDKIEIAQSKANEPVQMFEGLCTQIDPQSMMISTSKFPSIVNWSYQIQSQFWSVNSKRGGKYRDMLYKYQLQREPLDEKTMNQIIVTIMKMKSAGYTKPLAEAVARKKALEYIDEQIASKKIRVTVDSTYRDYSDVVRGEFVDAYLYLSGVDLLGKKDDDIKSEVTKRNALLRLYFAYNERFNDQGTSIEYPQAGLIFDNCNANIDKLGAEDMDSALMFVKMVMEFSARRINVALPQWTSGFFADPKNLDKKFVTNGITVYGTGPAAENLKSIFPFDRNRPIVMDALKNEKLIK